LRLTTQKLGVIIGTAVWSSLAHEARLVTIGIINACYFQHGTRVTTPTTLTYDALKPINIQLPLERRVLALTKPTG
jgi:hypothetical protein